MGRKSRSARRGPAALKRQRYRIAPDLGELCLRSLNAHFVTGTTLGGEQAILFPGFPAMYAYWFDRKGKYLRKEARELRGWSRDDPYEKQIQDRQSGLQAWVEELGLTPGPIEVQYFVVSDPLTLAVQDYPMGWDDAEWGEGGVVGGDGRVVAWSGRLCGGGAGVGYYRVSNRQARKAVPIEAGATGLSWGRAEERSRTGSGRTKRYSRRRPRCWFGGVQGSRRGRRC